LLIAQLGNFRSEGFDRLGLATQATDPSTLSARPADRLVDQRVESSRNRGRLGQGADLEVSGEGDHKP
jgi:hypothetical protein